MKITPQIFRTYSGKRPLTYAIWRGSLFLCYAKCLCSAMRAVEMIREGDEVSDEYPEGARFAWDMLSMTDAEIDEMCDRIDEDDDDGAEAVIARAEGRLFHDA